jgi:hypothetical protein
MSLIQQIHAIEQQLGRTVIRSGAAHEHEECSFVSTGWPIVDTAIGGGLIKGALHEWFGVEESDGATQPRSDEGSKKHREGAKTPVHGWWIPPLLPLVHITRRVINGASTFHYAVWIGRRCVPYGGALIGSDGDKRLLERSIFVMAERPDDRLWAVDLALRCRAVGVVIADGSGFDMAATRRIQLVAKAHQSPVLLVRPPWEVHELSAAQTRWLVHWDKAMERRSDEATKIASRVASARAEVLDKKDAKGWEEYTKGWNGESNILNPRWSVELLRCKGRQVGAIQQSDSGLHIWTLEWDRGQGVVRVLTPLAGATRHAGCSASKRQLIQA